ncbi:substrate-binding domain-containing protein [Nocardioides convexus]|uniref:PstS family phosphate ABC transporter substrate-binding protein n=1 Tax=Nocardioides convexus TaxID=2712224 RepID=UPI002418A2C6|nr:substrate-binding domain-containing protein [Nocardioides convexus]
MHRSDDSGTTKNFTDYLNKVAPEAWKYEAEDAFPVSGGLSAEGTSGVVKQITDTEGAIGYADASQTGDLKHVSVKVGEDYVAPSPEGAAKTVEVSPTVTGRDATDIAVDVDRKTTEAGAYPVILLSYLIACEKYDDATEAANVKGYFEYIVSDEGRAAAADNAGSAKALGRHGQEGPGHRREDLREVTSRRGGDGRCPSPPLHPSYSRTIPSTLR